MVNGTRLLYTRRFSIFIPPRRDDISNDTSNLYPVFNWTHFKIYLSRSIPFVSNIIPNSITSGNCKSAITPVHLPSRENLVLGKQFSTRGVEESPAPRKLCGIESSSSWMVFQTEARKRLILQLERNSARLVTFLIIQWTTSGLRFNNIFGFDRGVAPLSIFPCEWRWRKMGEKKAEREREMKGIKEKKGWKINRRQIALLTARRKSRRSCSSGRSSTTLSTSQGCTETLDERSSAWRVVSGRRCSRYSGQKIADRRAIFLLAREYVDTFTRPIDKLH